LVQPEVSISYRVRSKGCDGIDNINAAQVGHSKAPSGLLINYK
jgi:hypothetical protein